MLMSLESFCFINGCRPKCLLTQLDWPEATQSSDMCDTWQPSWLFMKTPKQCSQRAGCDWPDSGQVAGNLSEQEGDQTHMPEQIKHDLGYSSASQYRWYAYFDPCRHTTYVCLHGSRYDHVGIHGHALIHICLHGSRQPVYLWAYMGSPCVCS